jgi:hypothetical protein
MGKIIKIVESSIFNVFICLTLVSIWGGIIYRLYRLDWAGIVASLILSLATLAMLLILKGRSSKNHSEEHARKQEGKKADRNHIFLISYLVLATLCFFILWRFRTDQPIISPWQILPSYFFVIYSLATFSLIIFTVSKKQFSNFTIFTISIHYFLSLSVAIFVYRIGYGFDPFIHQSTVDLVSRTGAVLPKTNYYLGQYALIVIIHKILLFPIVWLDKLLVPALASAALPAFLWQALKKWFKDDTAILFSILILLAIPFSFFIVTTPQNLAYVFLLLVVLKGLTLENYFDLALVYVFSLAALLSQPIAGFPALVLALLLTIYHSGIKPKAKAIFYSILFISSIAALPAAFWLVEKFNAIDAPSVQSGNFGIAEFLKNILLSQRWPIRENLILNHIYLYGFNINTVLLLLFAAGIFIAIKYRNECRIFFIYLIASFCLAASSIVSVRVPFNYLIDYERENFPLRLMLVAAMLALPILILPIYVFAKSVLAQENKIKVPFIIFCALMITASLYLSYPRFDNYFNSHEYAVSGTDIEAVRWIEQNKKDDDFIVLANQQVSVAALREFGFKKYYNGNLFYYPIPTGSPLYQFYLDMVYKKPSRETMDRAMDLAGVKKGYFVLNKYWWASPKIVDEAELEADSFHEFGNRDVFVFEYKR